MRLAPAPRSIAQERAKVAAAGKIATRPRLAARAPASGSRVRKVTALRFSIRSKRSGKGAAAKLSSAAMVAGSHSGGAVCRS
ncbi:hypothetical protein JI743_08605 [Sphingopyxis sp. DHUNG17]|uniref:hypothetical protein n=1 Tax=Sphingopyxis jiangsuensis TaxID=2871171 RepID=UPI00191F56E1|nr:hypothetical protein [Sphingopyxis lutea]MBL0768863.1 hypothetical protein [Sphingopyxis lutea]